MESSKVVVVTCSLLAFACSLVATFAPAWIFFDGLFTGFFGACSHGTCVKRGGFLNNTSGNKASGAFMIIGTFVIMFGALIITLGIKEPSKMKVGGVVVIVGGLADIIGAAVFVGVANPFVRPYLSVCFYLAWVAAALAIVGGGKAIHHSRSWSVTSHSALV